MNQRERLLKTLQQEPVDRPPFVCPGGMMSMVVTSLMDQRGARWPQAHADANLMAKLTWLMHSHAGVENLGVPFCMTVEAEALGSEIDLGSLENEPRVTRYALQRLEQMDELLPLEVNSGRARVCVEAVRLLKLKAPGVPIIANVTGPVSLATSLVDPLLYYRALRRDKALAHRLTRFCTYNAITFGAALISAGADVICIADPSATGELIGAQAFAEFVLPCLNLMTAQFKSRYGTPAIVHICGNVKSLGASLGELEADAISVDSCVGIARLREQAAGKVTMGNVSTLLLEKGTAEEVGRAGAACLDNGVGILAPACGIGPRTPVANIAALAKSVTRLRGEAHGADQL
jgi:MtaA/CmuA family methyltransferase